MPNLKKLILIPLVSSCLLAENIVNTEVDTISTQERTYFEIAMGKPEKPLTDDELRNRVIYTNIIGAGVIALWGTAFWDYFTVDPIAGEVGWFGKDTKYGGADKLGHLYSTYLWSLGFSSLYEYWGMSKDEAIIYGSLTS